MSPAPVLQIVPRADLASRMLQYLTAMRFQSLVPGCRIAGITLREWGVHHPAVASFGPEAVVTDDRTTDLAALAARVRNGEIARVVFTAAGLAVKHLPDPASCRAVFRSPGVPRFVGGERHLLCPLGVGDRLCGQGMNFPLTPVEFFAEIVAETGLTPVFLGQTGANGYTDRLRAQFPAAIFLEPASDIDDFAVIRAARTIVVGVTLLAWLAAYLSDAERIFLPVTGLFHPMQVQNVALLPFADPRYHFTLFPIHYGVPLQHHAETHRRIAPYWRKLTPTVLETQFRLAPRFDPPIEQSLAMLDIACYLRENPDVAALPGEDDVAKVHKHYRWPGAFERRLPFALSEPWYATTYPKAALEVAQGDYSNFAQHYIAIGRAHGCRPLPDQPDRLTWWQIAQNEPIRIAAPSIATVATDQVVLETTTELAQDTTVSLGAGFAAYLAPKVAELFTRRQATEPLGIYQLRDVVLDASTMALFSGEPIPETLHLATRGDYERLLTKQVLLQPADPDWHHVVGGNRAVASYYHWMTQSLPAIDWGLRRHRHRHPNVALALPALLPWQHETLALLGHAGAPRLTLDPAMHYALASAEYAEFLGGRLAGVVSRAAGATYARLRQSVPAASDGAAAIYVARTDSRRRVAVNEPALVAMLERHGVRIIVPGSMSVTQQLATFRAARLVIGAHGAGLSNIMACEPGAHLYELLPGHYANFCFNRLAQTAGLHYWADVFPSEAGEAGPHEESWRIDLDMVAARLDAIRVRIAQTERADDG